MDRVERLENAYRAFNAREIDALIEQMAPDVDWPNAWEGGRLKGRAAVRDYWTRQWAATDPTLETDDFTTRLDGTVAVRVHVVVKDSDGAVADDRWVRHVYTFQGDHIARMDIEESAV